MSDGRFGDVSRHRVQQSELLYLLDEEWLQDQLSDDDIDHVSHRHNRHHGNGHDEFEEEDDDIGMGENRNGGEGVEQWNDLGLDFFSQDINAFHVIQHHSTHSSSTTGGGATQQQQQQQQSQQQQQQQQQAYAGQMSPQMS